MAEAKISGPEGRLLEALNAAEGLVGSNASAAWSDGRWTVYLGGSGVASDPDLRAALVKGLRRAHDAAAFDVERAEKRLADERRRLAAVERVVMDAPAKMGEAAVRAAVGGAR